MATKISISIHEKTLSYLMVTSFFPRGQKGNMLESMINTLILSDDFYPFASAFFKDDKSVIFVRNVTNLREELGVSSASSSQEKAVFFDRLKKMYSIESMSICVPNSVNTMKQKEYKNPLKELEAEESKKAADLQKEKIDDELDEQEQGSILENEEEENEEEEDDTFCLDPCNSFEDSKRN